MKKKLKALWTDESDVPDFANLPKESLDLLRRTLRVFVNFVVILLKRLRGDYNEPR